MRGGAAEHREQGTQKVLEPAEEKAEVVAGGGEDRIGAVAVAAIVVFLVLVAGAAWGLEYLALTGIGLNGYLLGHEYFELVALRHAEFDTARSLRRRNRGPVFVAGIIVAFLFTVPVLGWFMPAFAIAFMVHVYEGLQQKHERMR